MIGQIVSKFGVQLRVVYIGALALAIAALGATAGTALASEPDRIDPAIVRELIVQLNEAPDPDAVFAKLTPEQQEAVIEALSVASIEVIEEVYDESATYGAVGASDESCKTQIVTMRAKDSYNNELWSYSSRTRWRYDGNVITREPSFTRDGDVEVFGFEFVGHTDKAESGGKGESEHEDYTEGHFRFCILNIGCTQNHYPDIIKWQYGNGDPDSEDNF